MTRLPENLRRHVAWRTAGCCEDVELLLVHDSRKPKIGDKQISIVLWCSKQQILRLQISVHDTMVVEICDCRESSPDQVAGIGFVVVSLATDAVEELASKGKVGYQVDCSCVSAGRTTEGVETNGCSSSQSSQRV